MPSVKQSFPAIFLPVAVLAAFGALAGCSQNQLTRFAPPGIIKYEDIASEKPQNPVVAERIKEHKDRDDAKFPVLSQTPVAGVQMTRGGALTSQSVLIEREIAKELRRLKRLAQANLEAIPDPVQDNLVTMEQILALYGPESIDGADLLAGTPLPDMGVDAEIVADGGSSSETMELSSIEEKEPTVLERLTVKSLRARDADIKSLVTARNQLEEQVAADRSAAEQDKIDIKELTEGRDRLSEKLDKDAAIARREQAEPMPQRQE